MLIIKNKIDRNTMKLSIIYYSKMDRPWLLKREHGSYEQHAHFLPKKRLKNVEL